jgi:hypothetical protein
MGNIWRYFRGKEKRSERPEAREVIEVSDGSEVVRKVEPFENHSNFS